MQLVLHLVPQGGAPQAALDRLVQRALEPVDAQAISDVVENGFRKRIGLLEDHPHAPPQLRDVQPHNVFVIEPDVAFEPRVTNGFMHAVERAQQRGLPAARRTNQAGDPIGGNPQVNAEQSLFAAVIEVEVVDPHPQAKVRGRLGLASLWGSGLILLQWQINRNVHGLRPLRRHPARN